MQVSIPSYSKKSINSTAVLKESSERIFYCAVNIKIIIADEEFINCDSLHKKAIIYTTKFKTAFLKSLTASGNYNNSVTGQQNPNEFMAEKVVMAGASCKRYLQNKLGDRKRRRPNSALAETGDILDERVVVVGGGETSSTRLRQTTQRQSTHRHLIATINNLAKINKTDIQSHVATTTGSKKYLRSNKQDNELLRDCEELRKTSLSSPTYDTMNFKESDRSNIDNRSSAMSLANGNNHGFQNDENEENYKDSNYLQDHEGEQEDIVENFEKERIKQDTKNGNEETSYNCSCSSSSSNIRPPSLMDINENEKAHVPLSYHTTKTDEYECLGSIIFENHNTDVKDANELHQELNKNDLEIREMPKNSGGGGGGDDVENEHSLFTSVSSNEQQIITNHSLLQVTEQFSSSSRAQFSNIDDKQQVEYKNELSHLSSSISSENSSSSELIDETSLENINKKLTYNKSDQQYDEISPNENDEQSQKHVFKSINLTMNKSLLNNSTKHPQNTKNIGTLSSPEDEQYHHYNAEENNGCAIKISKQPTSTITPINITQQSRNQETVTIEHDCPDGVVSSSVAGVTDADDTDTDFMKEEEAGPFNNPKTSININISNIDRHKNSDCKETNLKLDPTTLDQSRHQTLEREEENSEKLHDKLENQQQQQQQQRQKLEQDEDQHFDKYLEHRTQVQHAVEFEMQQNERITHQQHEKDIIDAADKVYTQIEEQYHQQQQVTSIPSAYEQMISNHQHQTNNATDHDEHQQRHAIVQSQQQQQTVQHSMQQYSAEQLYQLQQQQQQEHHQQQLHMNHQMHQKQQEELQQQQQQQHHNIPAHTDPQREHRHSHIMDFLHPHHHHPNASNTHSPLHQQQQIHEVYHDLMMDEFHDEQNTPYKLGLSPSTVKHENQDDGYETSAGDVLTPNSHASSTHSVTPQHHMQHGALVTNVVKCEEQHPQHRLQQQSKHNSHVINERNENIQQELVANESSANITPRDPYHFIDDDLNSANSNNLRNILTPPHSLTRSNQEGVPIHDFMVMQSDASASNNLNQTTDMYALTNTTSVRLQHSQKPTCLDTNLSTTRTNNAELEQHYSGASADIGVPEPDPILNLQTKPIQKRRGRKKKIPDGGVLPSTLDGPNPNDVTLSAGFTKAKERKKHDRFNGMSEEEVVKRILPDHLCDNLDIVIIGINPGLFAAYKGHHYAGPGNHFWKCLYLSGLTQDQMNADEDFKLIKYGIGFTNMVQRATKGSADLTRKEIKEGSRILLEKLQRFRPKIAVFNGKLIFEVFSGKKDFNFGRQPECVEGTDTFIWVMPSSSARCAQLPRAADKVPFYAALKKFRDFLNGVIPHIDQSECIFTEERIKQQCEQENYKNQQNNASEANETTYQNVIGISNTNNPLQNPVVGYSFDPETNAHGGGEGPGPPPRVAISNVSNNFMMSSLEGTQHEKKKRGRPKKIKGQEMIDPVTGNKIQVNNQLMVRNNGEYSNILNLSVAQVSNSEMPKKKRGRPKKVKPHPNMLQQQDIAQATSMLSQKPNIMSIQSLTSDVTQGSSHQMQGLQTNHQHVVLYSTPPPHQRNIYSPMASPMASPSLNCSYTTNTPPSQPHHDKLGIKSNGRESSKANTADLVSSQHRQHPIEDQNYGDSPPPSSPNICTVDFEPPNGSTAVSSIINENVNVDLNAIHQRLHNSHQRSHFNSPISAEAIPDHNVNEHFQQWLSPQPNHNMHSPAAASTSTMFVNSPQQSSLNYHDQPQQQMQVIQQQQQPQHQEIHPQWTLRHQSRYDDPYLLSSQLHQPHPHNHAANHNHQSQHTAGDVARKSISGLESLVDQIPTISESETIALSSVAAVNAQVAAAAAVENRLQGIQNASISDSQVGDDSHFSSIAGPQNLLSASPTSAPSNNNQIQQSNTTTNLLNSNFSVSNLAASAASSNNNNNHHENYGLPSNNRPLANPNAYHHSNLMAAAVLAAAAANTPTNLSTPTAAAGTNSHHSSMYMDPHAHLTTHVPVNSIYPATAPPPTHHHHSAVAAAHHHHHAAAHYASAPQHSTSDYVTTHNPYAPTQSSVTTGHTLHMPSPNYPYGYATASSQSNYSAYPHSHHANHHHGHPHAHHLAMFDRLKPSDITGYTSGF